MRFLAGLLTVCLLSGMTAYAQKTPVRCATGSVVERYFEQFPALRETYLESRKEFNRRWQETREVTRRQQEEPLLIPVVVHILMPNPSIVTDEQVLSQLRVLNEDFAGLNADSTQIPAAFKDRFGKGRIQFCLAAKDPSGQPSTGINRKATNTISEPGFGDPIKNTADGGMDAWDPQRYLNIWVCETDGNTLGYTFLPGIPGLPANQFGLVILHTNFGTVGTALSPFNKGRTVTHEIGHFFNLEHIWGANDCVPSCTDDDEVADTPLQSECFFGAPSFPQTDACTPQAPGVMFMNYMDYVDDRAMMMFTVQQASRMETALQAFPERAVLLQSDACVPPVVLPYNIRLLQIVNPSALGLLCESSFIPAVEIQNIGSETLTSLRVRVTLDNNLVQDETIPVNLAPYVSTRMELDPVNTGAGSHIVEIEVTELNGQPDADPINNKLGRSFKVKVRADLPVEESFENVSLFPPQDWDRLNPDNYFTWELNTLGADDGRASAWINTFNYDRLNQLDDLRTPILNLPSADSMYVEFSWAAGIYSNPAERVPYDTLEVLLTFDCGETYTRIWKKGGVELNTSGSNNGSADEFIPNSSQWKRDKINVTEAVAGQSEVEVVFRLKSQYENNVFIDDIRVYPFNLPGQLKRQGYLIYPNPVRNILLVRLFPTGNALQAISIYNTSGQRVYQNRFRLGFASPYHEINMGHLASGLYFVHLTTSEGTRVEKIYKAP